MIRVSVNENWAVRCSAVLDVALAPVSAWGQLRDFRRYASQDAFHADIQMEGGLPKAGARLWILHSYAGFRVRRHGRILVWREGIGFSFSDLSMHGPRRGFPHVLSYRVSPRGDGSRLYIVTTGLWTANWISRPLARLWLWWVFGQVVRSVQTELLLYQVWRQRAHSRRVHFASRMGM